MKLKINGKELDFKFGARFINDLDNHFGMQMAMDGVNVGGQNFAVSFGMALTRLIPGLAQDDAGAVAKVLYSAGAGNSPRPSMDDIFDYLDECSDFAKLCNDIRNELEKSNVTKGKVTGLVEKASK